MATPITPNKFAIELRDKNFNLKKRLEQFVTSVQWEWNRIGGCGRCNIRLDGAHNQYEIDSDDDIRIYIPDTTGGNAELVYSGYVENPAQDLSSGAGSTTINAIGYYGILERNQVHDEGLELEYLGTEVSNIVNDIIDTFIVPRSEITLGTIQESDVTPDIIRLKGSVKECLATLFNLIGEVEYGVNADREFYWYNASKEFTHRFYLGNVGGEITRINESKDFRNIVNSIVFTGGKVNDSAFVMQGTSQRSIDKFGRFEEEISNGSITTPAAASLYMKGIFRQRAVPPRPLSITVANIKKRIEKTFPMGAVAVVDPDVYQDLLKYGITANGGDNVLYGRRINGGGNKKYGSTPRNQVDRIQYTLSPEDGRFDATIQFGNSLSVSRASASIKRLEDTLRAVNQRSL